VVLDACILMSGVLRPLLLNLAETGLFQPVWSSYIGLEWRRNAARLWPIKHNVLNDEWATMQQRFPQACFDPPMVENLISIQPQIPLSDQPQRPSQSQNLQVPISELKTFTKPLLRRSDAKDHHVIMAGVRACHMAEKSTPANVLTWNIRDFNRTELRQLHLGLLNPDQLLCRWWANHSDLLSDQLQRIIQTLISDGRRQPAPIADFLHRERLFRFKHLYLQSVS
ncbi:MAG: PIN domain-containing protein, partial [Burkholderiaceae bacterium]|nr:PIN domain-containing protein [Burkholderiaceae bacterium]